MKVLVIGQGGREHAIVRSLTLSSSVTEVHCVPGNSGMSQNALCHDLDWKNTEVLVQFCLKTEIDFVLIGPEEPLCAGLADSLRERGILVVGPSAQGARLEGSKVFAKEFMKAAGIPTAAFQIVRSVEETSLAASNFTAPYVLKADGLAAGKGVFICKTKAELLESAHLLFEKKIFGSAGLSAILEQFSMGWELSYLILTNGSEFETLPVAQDHKRLFNQDLGPNTGGMGTIAPLALDVELKKLIDQKIVTPTLKELQKSGTLFRGVIFFGIMVTPMGPSLLEFNCRFGDPETQVILPLIENDFGSLMKDLALGKLQPIKQKNMSATCVVLAAPGYPDNPTKGLSMKGDPEFETSSSYFIHSGTKKTENGSWITNGGRVICAIGLGSDFQESIRNAYSQSEKVNWEGLQKRTDIGSKITNPNGF